ncbi:bifunctional UDP-N-acetylglucosamine diphosphorylase/glucosamine-1-phosphate N-acetyltransferase GlmU [Adlercreutzia sp. ZJ304]|uniref:bifunctional UDP-N-acetylglucosamine diphosphorylase/glucosamine-1-phosphate N-acetyltransferase GlmU n=1 Tax=Adlercreutzia sp. ZJ304 TaxID=2709791 RepID=UPI0013EC1F47|nr:bifunctional UDP-N-acetylglucosamine diphosphorylase/glucosamine-1-phosphate N-acetyltransferase GlmU [Adlercreutzia sp. ZJ304]
MQTAAIILCAGEGTRMKSKKPKVAHEILGRPLVQWVVEAARSAGANPIVSIVGHGSDVVKPLVDGTIAVEQPQRLGTGDAVMCAQAALADFDGSVLVLSGDCPMISASTLEQLVSAREKEKAACAVLSMKMSNPFGYGRIVRTPAGEVERIVEQKDASDEEAAICECNSGFYCFDCKLLFDALHQVGNDNAAGEYYLTDVLAILRNAGKRVIAVLAEDSEECMGVNSRVQLSEASRAMQRRINTAHMQNGVTMMAPDMVWIGPDVKISADVELLPGVMLMGNTEIGQDCTIGPNCRLTDTIVGCGCVIDETVAIEARIDDGATCGPRAYLRPGAHLMENAKAGTHVEIKKSTIGPSSKVPHLSYIGDTVMGSGVNIGAGSITCNYDGAHKHPTTIGDNSFIGSDTMMVAPVNIGSNVVVGAGSVITKDVPDSALAVARARERIIEDWACKHAKK